MGTNTERKMAWITTIEEVIPIPNADRICQYRVGGWRVVDHKDKYQVGERVVYFSIDSWIPHDIAPFLSKGKEPKVYNGIHGQRLRTMKLRGALSQGLIMGMDELPTDLTSFSVGDDMTAIFSIQKWEPVIPAQLCGVVRGNFPAIWRKTDQERIQNLSDKLDSWRHLYFEVTEKLDGTSATYGFVDGSFTVCSRNVNLKESEDNTYWRVARKFDIEQNMRANGFTDYVIQGEIIGPGVQGNKYNLQDIDFYVFDVYDVRDGSYLTADDRFQIVKTLDLKMVPVIAESASLYDQTVDSILDLADGTAFLNKKSKREGLVYKCLIDGDISFKAISNKWLLKNE